VHDQQPAQTAGERAKLLYRELQRLRSQTERLDGEARVAAGFHANKLADRIKHLERNPQAGVRDGSGTKGR